MDDNVLFALCNYHVNNSQKKTRIRGYYGCLFCGEFIHNIPKPVANCPFCGRESKLIEKIDNMRYQMIVSIMKDAGAGYYSDSRAGKRRLEAVMKNRKEKVKS